MVEYITTRLSASDNQSSSDDCQYRKICKFYDNCNPRQFVKGEMNISDCWVKNTLDGILNDIEDFK